MRIKNNLLNPGWNPEWSFSRKFEFHWYSNRIPNLYENINWNRFYMVPYFFFDILLLIRDKL